MEIDFEISFEGLIWNTSYSNAQLCIECREGEKLDTTFHVLDLKLKECISAFYGCFDKWMTGLELFHNHQIILHGYDKEQNIHKKGIAFYNTTGELEYQFDYLTFQFITNDGVVAIDPNEKLVSIENGELYEFNATENAKPTTTETDVVLPIHYTAEDPHFTTIQRYLKESFQKEAVHGIDYVEFNDKILISFYLYDNRKLKNELFILNLEGQLLHHETLDEQLSGIGYGTFFIIKEALFYIQNKKTLRSITL